MAKSVVETVSPFSGHNKTCCLKNLRGESLHLLQMFEQAIPLIRGVAQFECLKGGWTEAALFREVCQGCMSRGALQLAAKPA